MVLIGIFFISIELLENVGGKSNVCGMDFDIQSLNVNFEI